MENINYNGNDHDACVHHSYKFWLTTRQGCSRLTLVATQITSPASRQWSSTTGKYFSRRLPSARVIYRPQWISTGSLTLYVTCYLPPHLVILHYVQHLLPSVLWHCWFDVRKSIRPVKIEWWGVVVVICLEWGADYLHMVQLMPLHPKTPSCLALFKSRLVLPSSYRLTQVVVVWLNGFSSSCTCNTSKAPLYEIGQECPQHVNRHWSYWSYCYALVWKVWF